MMKYEDFCRSEGNILLYSSLHFIIVVENNYDSSVEISRMLLKDARTRVQIIVSVIDKKV